MTDRATGSTGLLAAAIEITDEAMAVLRASIAEPSDVTCEQLGNARWVVQNMPALIAELRATPQAKSATRPAPAKRAASSSKPAEKDKPEKAEKADA